MKIGTRSAKMEEACAPQDAYSAGCAARRRADAHGQRGWLALPALAEDEERGCGPVWASGAVAALIGDQFVERSGTVHTAQAAPSGKHRKKGSPGRRIAPPAESTGSTLSGDITFAELARVSLSLAGRGHGGGRFVRGDVDVHVRRPLPPYQGRLALLRPPASREVKGRATTVVFRAYYATQFRDRGRSR